MRCRVWISASPLVLAFILSAGAQATTEGQPIVQEQPAAVASETPQ